MRRIVCVLLPGLDGTGKLLAGLASEISRYADPIVIAYPADRTLGYPHLTEYVQAQLPPDRDYCLIAESFSGPIAIAVASQCPENLRAVVLAATFASSPFPWLGKLAGELLVRFRLPVSRFLISLFLLNGRQPELVETIHCAASSVEPSVLAARMRSALASNATSELSRVAVPVLAIRALRDRTLPGRCVKQMAKHLPSIEILEVDGPHCILQVEARRISEEIIFPFLKSVLR